MTLASETARTTYSGNGSTSSFPTGFKFLSNSDVKVLHVTSAGTETLWTEGTQYSLTGAGLDNGGPVVVSTSPTDYRPQNGETLQIYRDPPLTQGSDLPLGGAFPSTTVENALDRLTMISQRIYDLVTRSIRQPDGDVEQISALPPAATRASKLLGFDAGGDFEAVSPAGVASTGNIVSPFMATVLDDTGASAARSTLGVAIGTDVLAPSGSGAALTGIRKQGLETIWIPAAAMRPTVSNGCAFLASVETTAGRPDMNVLDFDASADEHAQFEICFPKSWDEGTVTFRVHHTTTATDTDGVAWGLQGVAVSDGDTIDVAYGTPIVVTDAYQSTAEDEYVTAVSAAVTIAGAPAAGDRCVFRIFRDVSDAADTAAEDGRLLGVEIFFTTSAADDA
jgi:hypothetical protein